MDRQQRTLSCRAPGSSQRHGSDSGPLLLQNQFDCIDMSGNNIIRLEGFPKLPRLKMLLCCSNRISTFAPGLDRAPFSTVTCVC